MAAVSISSSSSPCRLNSTAFKNHIIIQFHSVASTPPILPFPPKRQHIGTDECDQFCATISARPFLKCGRTRAPFSQKFSSKGRGEEDADSRLIKRELLQAIAPLDRGAQASPLDHERVDQIARELEAANRIKEPLKSSLLNGKWELLYTTSQSILQTRRPKLLRPNGKIYQAINLDTLRAQNMETWPFFNQATANLVPLNEKRVAVKFDSFKIAGLIPIGARGSGGGQLEITYLDEELRISRGNQGNLFILRMVDPSYKVPL